MRKVILYIATSLDGFIARSSGEVDWLFSDQDYGYSKFISNIDTVLMGGKTYRQIIDFGVDWPYAKQKSYVFTHDVSQKSTSSIQFIHHDLPGVVEKLKKKKGKDIWLVGGSEINSMFLKEGLIDELQLFIHPLYLGKGVPIFNFSIKETWFKAHDIEEFDSGMVKMVYVKKELVLNP